MKITIESTTKVVEIKDAQTGVWYKARIWQGETNTGIPVHCYIPRIATDLKNNQEQFHRELEACVEPREELKVIPLRMIV